MLEPSMTPSNRTTKVLTRDSSSTKDIWLSLHILLVGLTLAVLCSIVITIYLAVDLKIPILLTVNLLICLLMLSWLITKKGRHPVFLFLATLLIFQGGRLIAWLLSDELNPFQVVFVSYPLYLRESTAKATLLLIIVSAFVTFVIALLTAQKKIPKHNAFFDYANIPYANFFLLLFIVTSPFWLYKNLSYLAYAIANGGYLAIYQGDGEHLQNVGTLARLLSQLSFAAFICYFVYEPHKKRLIYTTTIFVIGSVIELLIGLRGKFIIQILGLVYLYTKKFRNGYSLKYLIILLSLIVVMSLAIEIFRENKAFTFRGIDYFLAGQGSSMLVTGLAVEYDLMFSPNAFSYFFNGIVGVFKHQNSFDTNQLFATDLSRYINPEAFKNGYATGSSFLAESYLVGGVFFVILASAIIGALLSAIDRIQKPSVLAFSYFLFIYIMYLPRSSLLEPVGQFIKAAPFVCIAFILYVIYQKLKYVKTK